MQDAPCWSTEGLSLFSADLCFISNANTNPGGGEGGLAAPRREEIDHSTKCILKQYQFCSGVISHHLGKVGPVPDPGVNMWSVLVNKKKREQFWDGSRKDFPSLIRESGQEVSV